MKKQIMERFYIRVGRIDADDTDKKLIFIY